MTFFIFAAIIVCLAGLQMAIPYLVKKTIVYFIYFNFLACFANRLYFVVLFTNTNRGFACIGGHNDSIRTYLFEHSALFVV